MQLWISLRSESKNINLLYFYYNLQPTETICKQKKVSVSTVNLKISV